jgi:hypothetical protein
MANLNMSGRATAINPLTPNYVAGYGSNPYAFAKSGQQTAAYVDPNGPVGNAAYDAYLNSPEQIQYRSTFWGNPAMENLYQQQLEAIRPQYATNAGGSGGGSGSSTPAQQTPINPPPLEPSQVINAPTYDAGPGADDTWMTQNAYEEVYNTIAPTLWDTYERNVENPTINRFAGSGSLGSAVGGLSGAAADVLQTNRTQAGNSIANQAYTASQAPLLQQMTGDQQAASSQYQGALSALLAQYAAQANASSTEATQPYQATISQLEYPYQIFPGLFGGSMSQPVTTAGGGGGKK